MRERYIDSEYNNTKWQGGKKIKRKYVQQKESQAPRTGIRGKRGRATSKEVTGKVHKK